MDAKLYNKVHRALEEQGEIKNIDIYNYSVDDFVPLLTNELLINILLILENDKQNNISSSGVDISCRIIYEISALLKANKEGLLSDEQKKLFLLNYIGSELKSTDPKNEDEELRQLRQKKLDLIYSEYESLLGFDRQKSIEISKDKNAFLKYGGEHTYFSLDFFVKRILGNEANENRRLISVFIHPSYYEDNSYLYKESILGFRQKIINHSLKIASEFIPTTSDESYAKTRVNEEFLDEKTIETIKRIKKAFKDTFLFIPLDKGYKETNLEETMTRFIVFNCFRVLRSALIDLFITESFGYKTNLVARFKPLIEMISLLGYIESHPKFDHKMYGIVANTFLAIESTRLRDVIKKVNNNKPLTKPEKKEYDKYYRELASWYDKCVDEDELLEEFTIQDFEYGLINNWLYFLDYDFEFDYRTLVKQSLFKFCRDKRVAFDILKKYDWALKVDHVCVYKSVIKENKMYHIIPNTIIYMIEVIDAIYPLDDEGHFFDFFKDLVNEYNSTRTNKYKTDLLKKYNLY